MRHAHALGASARASSFLTASSVSEHRPVFDRQVAMIETLEGEADFLVADARAGRR
jgi:hypothetical protein